MAAHKHSGVKSSLARPRARFGGCLFVTLLVGCEQAAPAGPQSPDAPAKPEKAQEMPEDQAADPQAEPELIDEVEVMYPGVPPAISGGTLALSADGRHAVASDPDRDLIHVVTLDDGKVRSAKLIRGSEPGRIALDPALGEAHVVLRGAGKLARVRLADGSIVQQTSVCALPRGVALDAGDGTLMVACAEGTLVALSAKDHSTLWRSELERDLRDVVIDAKGRLFVSRYRNAELLEVSRQGELLGRQLPPATERMRTGGLLLLSVAPAVTGGGSSQGGSEADAKVAAPVPEGTLPEGTPPETTLPTLKMAPTLAWRTMLDPQGGVVMLHQRAQTDEVPIEPGGYGLGGCETIAQTGFSTFGPEEVVTAQALGGTTLAVDAAFSPDGAWYAVAAPGELQLPQRTGAVAGGGLAGGLGGGAIAPGGPGWTVQIFANTSPTPHKPEQGCQFPNPKAPGEEFGQAIAVAFTADGKLIAQSREPAQLAIFELTLPEGAEPQQGLEQFALKRTIALSPDSARDPGHDLFHANVGGGLACASCHGEARDDAHVWTFAGIGPRRTQTMRGGFLGTEPFHWEGDMAGFRQLVDDVMTVRMSGFKAADADVDALATWIDAQPALRAARRMSDAATRGKRLFESSEVGCTGCHSGPLLTDNKSADVGTGETLQVPSLLGLALRAPYLHDGCAASLSERFAADCGGGDKHGHTSQLSKSEIGDLVAFLETL